MKTLTRLIGWFLVPLFAVGRFAGRLLPEPRHRKPVLPKSADSIDWLDFVRSYEKASGDVVKWWLEGDGYTLDGIIASDFKKETARDIMFNLMNGVRDGFIDPEFARCLTYALSCAAIKRGFDGVASYAVPSPAWPCEYCVFFNGLDEVLLPEPASPDRNRERGNKSGKCQTHGRVTMKEVPAGSCSEFVTERRKHLKVLKQTNEELQLWYLVHRHRATDEELIKMKDFRDEIKTQIQQKLRERRKRRATDHSFH